MGTRPCCRSCRHCTPPSGGAMGWCQLRHLAIHPDLAPELWCHHWTPRPPRLPVIGPGSALEPRAHNHQLALAELLES